MGYNASNPTMTNNDDQNIESIAQTIIDDASHYVNSVTAMANNHELSAVEDIISSTGVKLVVRGTRIDGGLYKKLFNHHISGQALEKSLSVAESVTPDSLALEISCLIDEDPWFKQLAQKSGDAAAMRHGVSRLLLPHEILFRLTIAREQHRELYRHSLSVAIISHYLALRLDLKPKSIDNVLIAAFSHDLGELYTDPAIIEPGHRINDDERRFIYVHPITGWLIVRNIQNLDPEVARAVVQHHERLDGSGYPNGNKSESIGIAGRILAAADTSASIIARFRDHRRLSILLRLNGAKYDRTIVDLLLEAIPPRAPDCAQDVDEDSIKCVANFAQLFNGWSHLRSNAANAAAVPAAFVTERLYRIRTVVVDSGFDPDSLDFTLHLAAGDSTIATELVAVIDELKFQLADLEREIDRRAAVWLDTIDPITTVALNDWRRQLHECNHDYLHRPPFPTKSTQPARVPALE